MNTAINYLLNGYQPHDDLEWSDVECLRDFVSKNTEDRIYRNVPGRPTMTASAIVVNSNLSKILVAWQGQHGFYKQLRGTANGNSDLVDVAARQARDECGFCGELLSPNPIDFIIWANNEDSGRQHIIMDIAFLFCVFEATRSRPQKESGIKWISMKAWKDMRFNPHNETIKQNPQNAGYYHRIANKIQNFSGR